MSTPSIEALRPPVTVKVPAEALLLLVVVAVGAPARRRPLEDPRGGRLPRRFRPSSLHRHTTGLPTRAIMAGVILFLAPATCIGLLGAPVLQTGMRSLDFGMTQRLLVEAGLVGAGLLGLRFGHNTVSRGSTEPNWGKLLIWGSLVSLGFFTFLSGGATEVVKAIF